MSTNDIIKFLNSAIDELKKVSNEKEEMSNSKRQLNNQDRLCLLARKTPFDGHILSKKDELVQELYITALLAIALEEVDDITREKYILQIGRIIASYDNEVDYTKYLTKYMKIDSDFWNDFSTFVKDDLANAFVVDTFVMLNAVPNSDVAILNSAIDVIELFGMQKSNVKNLALVSKAILKQSFIDMVTIPNVLSNINLDIFLNYFADNQYSHISSDLSGCKNTKGKLLIVNEIFKNKEEILNMDDFLAREISFLNCKFSRIRGIVSTNKTVIFDKCIFESNMYPTSKDWRGKSEIEEGVVYMSGSNIILLNSFFKDCSVSRHLLEIENGTIKNCDFQNCRGLKLPCTYLLMLSKVDIDSCSFSECYMDTDRKDRRNTTGGLVSVEKGMIRQSTFEECTSYGDSSYGSYASYAMQIVKAIHSKVELCRFTNCYCSTCDSYDRNVSSYILGLDNSSQVNNEFVDCISCHYEYSESKGFHNVGNI